MYLIYWEYAGMNDPMWDLADVTIEAQMTPELETYAPKRWSRMLKNLKSMKEA